MAATATATAAVNLRRSSTERHLVQVSDEMALAVRETVFEDEVGKELFHWPASPIERTKGTQ